MKSFLILVTFLGVFGGMYQVSHAQVTTCSICQTQVNTIQQFDFGTSSGFKSIGFQANVSGSPFCQVLGFQWSTSMQFAAITEDGSWARIDFPLAGILRSGGINGNTVQVCCTYSLWIDRNRNGNVDPEEICEDTLCINVNL